jgi:hypothetical protein
MAGYVYLSLWRVAVKYSSFQLPAGRHRGFKPRMVHADFHFRRAGNGDPSRSGEGRHEVLLIRKRI